MASSLLIKKFWEALNKGDDDAAYDSLRSAALPLPGDTPSPRVAALMLAGEWDANTRVTLRYMREGCCAGTVNNDSNRFCGRQSCATVSHSKGSKSVPVGWYVSAGSGASGCFFTPMLPPHQGGGPIDRGAARLLTSSSNPFKLTRDQWKFVIEGWYALDVETSNISPSDGTGSAPSWEEVPEDLSVAASPTDLEAQPASTELTVDTGSPMVVQVSYADFIKTNQLVQTLVLRVTVLETQYKEIQMERDMLKQELEQLASRLARMEQALQRASSGNSPLGSESELQAILSLLSDLKFEVYNEEGRVMRIKKLLTELSERENSGGGIEIGNFRFPSKTEFLAWYEDRDPPIGFFLDAHAMMHAIAPAHSSLVDTMKLMEAQKRVAHKTGLETAVRTSFKTIIPSVFVTSTVSDESSTFAALKTSIKDYNAWKPPQTRGTGVSKRLEDGVLAVDRRIGELRFMSKTIDPQAVELSSMLARDSLLFVKQLCYFVEEQQTEFCHLTGYTPVQVWEMQLECIQAILEELDAARRPFIDAAEHEPGMLLWAMLQAWVVQQRYMKNRFHDDPALTGILVRRLLMCGEDKAVAAKLLKMEELQKAQAENYRQAMQMIKKLQEQVIALQKK